VDEQPIKKKIDLEIEVTPNNIGVNPYQKWIHLAKTVDAWRIFPRIFVGVYIVLLYDTVTWFMRLGKHCCWSNGGSLRDICWNQRTIENF